MMPKVDRDTTATIRQVHVKTFDDARVVTRRYAKTFYFASFALPPEKRLASYALYSFCRTVDNIVDEAQDKEHARMLIAEMRRSLESIFDPDQAEPRWAALQQTVLLHGIRKEYFLDLLDGVEMDLTGVRFESFRELHRYCYHVASVVGLMMTRILRPDSAAALSYAKDLGTAMQLTNILRDIGEDFASGRVYLPRQEMHEWGISDEDLQRGVVTPAFRSFMRFQIARAREFYVLAEPGIEMLPNDGSRYCVRLMSVLYKRILNAIEANDYDVFSRRAHVPFAAKLRLAAALPFQRQESPYFLLKDMRRGGMRNEADRHKRRASHAVPSI
ncbi:MAG: squalene/phytoene synthase family protein [Bacteroidetes bacterium]|nr:squalene/phytoene synthase family protein [Bacteroidota bacterium]